MSSYSIIYVEYKDNRDSDWHILQTYVPLEDREWDREKSSTKELKNVVELGGIRFCVANEISKCGIIRDLLNDPGKEFNNRGFPEDLSSGVREILENQEKEIDNLNKADQRENKINHDWRYGKSWCYLTELESAVIDSYNYVEKEFMKSQFSEELVSIYTKLESIESKLFPDNKNNTKEKETYYGIDSSVKEELDDLIYARSFCNYITDLVRLITGTYILENNIRLIYYTE